VYYTVLCTYGSVVIDSESWSMEKNAMQMIPYYIVGCLCP